MIALTACFVKKPLYHVYQKNLSVKTASQLLLQKHPKKQYVSKQVAIEKISDG